MERIFIQLVNMSLVAGWLILAVLLIRGIFKKLPKVFRCVLWGLVALRLICPWSIESDVSIIPKAEIIADDATEITILSDKQELDNNSADVLHNEKLDNNINVNNSYEGNGLDTVVKENNIVVNNNGNINNTKESSLSISINALSNVWIMGIVIMAVYYIASYVILKRKVRVSIRYDKNIYLCDNISSAFILGLVRPKIYVPSHLSDVELANVIKHERAHLSRHDNWWKPLGFLLLSVYWFNPIIWVAYIMFCKDVELACDEKVVKAMDVAEVKEYSNTLLECSISRKLIVAAPLAFGEVAVKSRIKSVLNYKRPAFWVIIAGVIVSVAIAIGFMVTPTDYDKNIDEDLDKFISDAIIEQYESDESYRYYSCESHSIIGVKEKNDKTTVYMVASYGEYVWDIDDISEMSGSSGPMVITVNKNSKGNYSLEELWLPRDGKYYTKDIRDKFPNSLEDKVFDKQSVQNEIKADCDAKAKDYFHKMGYGADRYIEYISSDELEMGPMYISLNMNNSTFMTGLYFASYAYDGTFLLTEDKLILRFPSVDMEDEVLVFRREGDNIIYDKEASKNEDLFKYKDGDMFILKGEYTEDEITEDLEDAVIEYDKNDHAVYISSNMNQIDLNMKSGTCSVGNLYLSVKDMEGTFEIKSDKLIIRICSMETYYEDAVIVFRKEGDAYIYHGRASINSDFTSINLTDGEVFNFIENSNE